ncbi:hypothetical protein L2E82_07306 [Cichorium intybus]|uniref:Uncharacterized protein n=1 Tax=Cichorium intybus TaxID=13427 RepID=A0ACB9G533_CICIN|nr:hypothetical protein L2E82_07306 [Cichorium intybus]
MGTGSPLNTYRPPPPVPGDFYPLVSSSPAYHTPCLDLSLTSDCRATLVILQHCAIVDSQTLEIAAPLQYRSPTASKVLSTASKHQRLEVPELIDIVLQDRRFHLSKYATYNRFSFRVYRRTDPSDKSMIVKDGYQWRKYEQKVTRIGYYLHACCVLV